MFLMLMLVFTVFEEKNLVSKIPCILVTATGGLAGLNAVHSLQEAGAFKIVSVDAEPFAPGLYMEGVKPYVVPLAKERHYSSTLLKICEKEKVNVVLPCSDEEVLALSRDKDFFSRKGIAVPISDYKIVLRASDRWTMLKAISKLKVKTPKTFSPSTQSEFESALKQIDFPLVVRPRVSRGARGITYCQDREAAALAFKLLKQEYENVIVQELVPGGPGSVHAVQTLWDKHHKLCAAAVYQKLREKPPTGGVSWAGRTVHNDKLKDLGVSIMQKLGPWIGPAGVEFKVSSSDNQPYVMEVNPRLQAHQFFLAKAGINFVYLWLLIALNGKVAPQFEYEERYFIRSPSYILISGKEVMHAYTSSS
jgi:carbamoylphosphate synthase large subunit